MSASGLKAFLKKMPVPFDIGLGCAALVLNGWYFYPNLMWFEGWCLVPFVIIFVLALFPGMLVPALWRILKEKKRLRYLSTIYCILWIGCVALFYNSNRYSNLIDSLPGACTNGGSHIETGF